MPGGRVLLQQLRARDIAWHEIRRELDATEFQLHRLRHTAHHQCLREAGYTDEQGVTTRHDCEQYLVERGLLADDVSRDLRSQCLCGRNQRREI